MREGTPAFPGPAKARFTYKKEACFTEYLHRFRIAQMFRTVSHASASFADVLWVICTRFHFFQVNVARTAGHCTHVLLMSTTARHRNTSINLCYSRSSPATRPKRSRVHKPPRFDNYCITIIGRFDRFVKGGGWKRVKYAG